MSHFFRFFFGAVSCPVLPCSTVNNDRFPRKLTLSAPILASIKDWSKYYTRTMRNEFICPFPASLSLRYQYSLFFPAPVEEASPLETGLFASNPEDRGYPNYQSHEILHEKENQIWTTHLSDLQRGKRRENITQTIVVRCRVY